MTKYNVAFANYPESFRGYVVSATKICLQFDNPQVKLRLQQTDKTLYNKGGTDSDRYVPVYTSGTNIDCIAIGCQMPVVEDYQLQLIEAYLKYFLTHKKTYHETYGKKFKDFVNILTDKVLRLQSIVNEEE